MKCTLEVFSALAFVSILDGFGKFTYLIGGIQLYKLSFKEGEIYEAGVIKPGKTSVQVIVGTKVQFVADAFSKLCE